MVTNSYDGSDGKAVDSGLEGPGYNPRQRQENFDNIFSRLRLVVLEPMRSTSNTQGNK